MELTRCTPKYMRTRRHNRVPSLFDDFFSPLFNERRYGQSTTHPVLAVDIFERDGKIVIEAEIPGVEKEDIHVDVKGKLVTLGGERKDNKEVKDEDSYRRERRYGKFERTFNLPYEVNEDLIEAVYKNGLLTLEISKPEEEQVKKIVIN